MVHDVQGGYAERPGVGMPGLIASNAFCQVDSYRVDETNGIPFGRAGPATPTRRRMIIMGHEYCRVWATGWATDATSFLGVALIDRAQQAYIAVANSIPATLTGGSPVTTSHVRPTWPLR